MIIFSVFLLRYSLWITDCTISSMCPYFHSIYFALAEPRSTLWAMSLVYQPYDTKGLCFKVPGQMYLYCLCLKVCKYLLKSSSSRELSHDWFGSWYVAWSSHYLNKSWFILILIIRTSFVATRIEICNHESDFFKSFSLIVLIATNVCTANQPITVWAFA